MTNSSISRNSMVALCDGVATTLTVQPYHPSSSVLRGRRRTLFGAPLPSSSANNEFEDLYNGDGTCLTIRSRDDFLRVAGHPDGWSPGLVAHVSYPQTIELNEPWSIGAPGQQRDIHFAFALLHQLDPNLSTSRLQPGPDDLLACDFSRLCRRQTPDYRVPFAADRAAREICTIPIFKNPKVFMIPVKAEEEEKDGWIRQAWFPWQVCVNCLAGRAKARCTLWLRALRVQTPMKIESRRPDQTTADDEAYGWFAAANRDAFLAKDLGYYDLWLCRDGTQKPLADV